MDGEFLSDAGTWGILLWGIGYLAVLHYLSRREARPRRLTEAELLVKLAKMGPHSEFEIFHIAAEEWNVPRDQVEGDFKTYLQEDILPYYVNGYLRKRAAEEGNRYRSPFLLGGGSLPWLR